MIYSRICTYLRTRASALRRNESGIYVVFVMISFVALAMVAGLAVDAGRAYVEQASLARTVDSASLAAAREFVPNQYPVGTPLATSTNIYKAACNAALMNNVPCANSNIIPKIKNTVDARGNSLTGVEIAMKVDVPTRFLRLGRFFGCKNGCDKLTVNASAISAPGGLTDIAMNLDDTGSMGDAPRRGATWISQAKLGARALVDTMIPTTATSTYPTKVAMAPFRGCYNTNGSNGCIDSREFSSGDVVSLSTSNSILRNGINALSANGGSGSNVCDGLAQGYAKLFQTGVSRANAQKFLIILTDAENQYGASSGFSQCQPSGSSNREAKMNYQAYRQAETLRSQGVEIFVVLYDPSSSTVPTNCSAPTSGTVGTTTWSATDVQVGRCLAPRASNVYLAPDPEDILAVFQQIIKRLPVRLVN